MNNRTLLCHAKSLAARRPDLSGLLKYIEGDFLRWWELALGLTIERQAFSERVFAAWNRGQDIEGVTIDPIPLGWAIEMAADLQLTANQRATLREDIGAFNEVIRRSASLSDWSER